MPASKASLWRHSDSPPPRPCSHDDNDQRLQTPTPTSHRQNSNEDILLGQHPRGISRKSLAAPPGAPRTGGPRTTGGPARRASHQPRPRSWPGWFLRNSLQNSQNIVHRTIRHTQITFLPLNQLFKSVSAFFIVKRSLSFFLK